MKKLILSALAICLSVGTISTSKKVHAHNDKGNIEQEIFEEELQEAIISGDGSAENPYIIDSEKAPNFTAYLDEKGQEAIQDLQTDTVSTYGIFDNVLMGTSHYNQTSGGTWTYERNAPSVVSNDTLWMKSVFYQSYSDVINICAGFSSSSFIETFKGSLVSIVGKSVTAARDYLVLKGFTNAAALAIARWVGCGTTYIGYAILANELATFFNNKPYLDARDAQKGLLHISYNTSYNGSWYSHSYSEIWSNYPTAKEPKPDYGEGTYYPS